MQKRQKPQFWSDFSSVKSCNHLIVTPLHPIPPIYTFLGRKLGKKKILD